MVRFLARRVLWGLVTLALVVTLAFFAVHLLLPYDYAVGLGQRPRSIERIREMLGLNRPLVVQWLDYMWHFIHGDLGTSYDGYRVSTVLGAFLPVTVTLFAVGGVVAYLLGEWFGRLVAWSRSRPLTGASSAVSVVLFAAFPPFLLFVLDYFLRGRMLEVRSWFGLAPVFGSVPAGPPLIALAVALLAGLAGGIVLRGWARRRRRRILSLVAVPVGLVGTFVGLAVSGVWSEMIDRLLWPSAVFASGALVLIAFGESMLVMRAGVRAEKAEDYVFTARAKGVPEPSIRDHHVAPNVIVPTIARLLSSIPFLLGGLVIIELASDTYGVGTLFFGAISSGDVPIILGILTVMGIVSIVARIVLDVISAVADPRARVGGGAQ